MTFENEQILFWLSKKFNVTYLRLQEILKAYPSLQIGLEDNFSKLKSSGVSWLPKDFSVNLAEINLEWETLMNQKIGLISVLNEEYPEIFKQLNQPPVLLFYLGNLEVLKLEPKLTVVGSRSYTKYTESAANKILNPVAGSLVVVSGLAYGVDTLAHKITVKNSGKAIAVIGSGLDDASFYPKENLPLKQEIIAGGGLILSELPPGTQPKPYYFPQRNRLLAALSEVTLVLQAGVKSGTLITAAAARDFGKTVATIPVGLFDTFGQGNLNLLKDGANLILETEDLLSLLNIHNLKTEITPVNIQDPVQAKIYSLLEIKPIGVDQLASETNLNFDLLQTNLTLLELEGLVKNIGQNTWVAVR